MLQKDHSQEPQIRKSFDGMTLVIVTNDQVLAKILTTAFRKRGGKAVIVPDGYGLLTYMKKQSALVDVVIVTGNLGRADAKWIAKIFRCEKRFEIDTLWFIGDNPVEHFDGHTKRPFRPVDLLSPVYKKIMQIHKERNQTNTIPGRQQMSVVL